jgi:hypothetical protein
MATRRKKNGEPIHRNVIANYPLVDPRMVNQENTKILEKITNGDYSKPDNLVKRGNFELKFRNDFMRQVYYLAKLGARDVDIAQFFGITISTLDSWKVKNLDFIEALKEGKWMFGFRVSETLGNRALGYDYEEVEYSQHVDRFGDIRDLKKVTQKHMAPDVTAIIFFLKNRHRDLWADVNKTEVDARYQVELSKKLDLTVLSEEERKMVKSIAIKNISTIHGVSGN